MARSAGRRRGAKCAGVFRRPERRRTPTALSSIHRHPEADGEVAQLFLQRSAVGEADVFFAQQPRTAARRAAQTFGRVAPGRVLHERRAALRNLPRIAEHAVKTESVRRESLTLAAAHPASRASATSGKSARVIDHLSEGQATASGHDSAAKRCGFRGRRSIRSYRELFTVPFRAAGLPRYTRPERLRLFWQMGR